MSGAVRPRTAPVALALVLAGVWWLATVDSLVRSRVAGAGWRAVALAPVYPLRSGLRLLLKETRSTEVPDSALWRAAPVLLIGAVLAAFAVMPLAPDLIGPDLSVGVVYVTAMLALVMVAVFAAGWGPNSKYPLIAGYRFIGLMLAYEMPFAITIIAVALPTESLALGDIVAAQKPITFLMMIGEMMIMVMFMIAFMMNPAGLNPMSMVHQPCVAAGAGRFAGRLGVSTCAS